MRNTDIDEPRFFAPRDHLYREAERGFRLLQQLRCVLRHTQGIGRDRAHLIRRKAPQALIEARQRLNGTQLRWPVEQLAVTEAGSQPNGFLETVKRIDLVIDDAGHLQPEAVRSEIDCCEKFVGHATEYSESTGTEFNSRSPASLCSISLPAR